MTDKLLEDILHALLLKAYTNLYSVDYDTDIIEDCITGLERLGCKARRVGSPVEQDIRDAIETLVEEDAYEYSHDDETF